MNPILLQKQLRDNAADANELFNDLKSWGEEMKKKEESVQKAPVSPPKPAGPKKPKTCVMKEKSKPKGGYTDYSAWDKFDAEAECEKVDYNENDESELSDEHDEAVRDEAYVEKEKGNKFVKLQKWDKAIECYNKAINCYSYDPIFYANRALCYLKKQDFVKAELDCTMAIRLDSTYAKAFHRRATARESLGKLNEAETDFLKVLELEPHNKESFGNLDALRKKLNVQKGPETVERPVSKFTASRNKKYAEMKKHSSLTEPNKVSPVKTEPCPKADDVIPVKVIVKPAHSQSKKPLKRVEIKEVVGMDGPQQPVPQVQGAGKVLNTDDLKVIERQTPPPVHETLKENKNHANTMKMKAAQVDVNPPANSVQFYSEWSHLKTLENRYAYMKLIKPEKLPVIFKESLESNVFSEMLEVLCKCYVKNGEEVFSWLKFLSEIRRFSMIVLFMVDADKGCLRKLFDYVQNRGEGTEEEREFLLKKFEL